MNGGTYRKKKSRKVASLKFRRVMLDAKVVVHFPRIQPQKHAAAGPVKDKDLVAVQDCGTTSRRLYLKGARTVAARPLYQVIRRSLIEMRCTSKRI